MTNSYIEKIKSNVSDYTNINQANEFIDSLPIANNSKRMYVYWWAKFLEEQNIPSDGLINYKQTFTPEKNDLTFEEVEICRASLWDDKISFLFNALLETGCRVSEFISITWQEVNSTQIGVKTAKNNEEYRYVFISDDTLNTIYHLKAQDFDFKTLNEDNIQYELRKLGKKANLTISLSPHVLRRTKGSILRLNGAAIEDIADILGHKNMETTRKYYSKLNAQYLESISSLSSVKPSDSIEIQQLRKENELLKKENILLRKELENAKKQNKSN